MKTTENDLGQIEKQFNGTLVSVSDTILKFNNENKTEYRPCTIKFVDEYEKPQLISAIVYEKSYQHGMKIGEKYMTTARFVDDQVYINISHLAPIGERANASMFKLGNITEDVKTFKKTLEEKMD